MAAAVGLPLQHLDWRDDDEAVGAGPHTRSPPAVISDIAGGRAAIAIGIVCGLGIAAGAAVVWLAPVLVGAVHLGVPVAVVAALRQCRRCGGSEQCRDKRDSEMVDGKHFSNACMRWVPSSRSSFEKKRRRPAFVFETPRVVCTKNLIARKPHRPGGALSSREWRTARADQLA